MVDDDEGRRIAFFLWRMPRFSNLRRLTFFSSPGASVEAVARSVTPKSTEIGKLVTHQLVLGSTSLGLTFGGPEIDHPPACDAFFKSVQL